MRTEEIRVDRLTGVYSVHPDMSGKPFPTAARNIPDVGAECALCRLVQEPLDENFEIEDEGSKRPVLRDDHYARTTTNRWSPVESVGRADLIVLARHAEGLGELDESEMCAFLSHIFDMAHQHQGYAGTLMTTAVGRGAGSSQPHLHGQVVSTGVVSPQAWVIDVSAASLDDDIAAATTHSLLVRRGSEFSTYVPYAPAYAGEVRIVAGSLAGLTRGLKELVDLIETRIGALDYRVVFHRGDRYVAQLVLQFSRPGLHSDILGLTVISAPVDRLAAKLGAKRA